MPSAGRRTPRRGQHGRRRARRGAGGRGPGARHDPRSGRGLGAHAVSLPVRSRHDGRAARDGPRSRRLRGRDARLHRQVAGAPGGGSVAGHCTFPGRLHGAAFRGVFREGGGGSGIAGGRRRGRRVLGERDARPAAPQRRGGPPPRGVPGADRRGRRCQCHAATRLHPDPRGGAARRHRARRAPSVSRCRRRREE